MINLQLFTKSTYLIMEPLGLRCQRLAIHYLLVALQQIPRVVLVYYFHDGVVD